MKMQNGSLQLSTHISPDQMRAALKKNKTGRIFCSPAHGQVKLYSFTLIELLVVISIISVLASMLLPALSQAKGVAKSAACQSNLKQCGAMLSVYRSDFNNYVYPVVGNSADGSTGWENDILAKCFGYQNQTKGTNESKMARNQPDAFFCPDSHFPKTKGSSRYIGTGNYGIYYIFTGAMKNLLVGSANNVVGQRLKSYKLDAFKKAPTKIPCLFDCSAGTFYLEHIAKAKANTFIPGTGKYHAQLCSSTDARSQKDFQGGRHNLKENMLFMDGHLESIPVKKIINEIVSCDEYLYICVWCQVNHRMANKNWLFFVY